MELTKENYFDVKEIDGVPVISNSASKHILPDLGGSDAHFEWYLSDLYENEEKKHLTLGKKIHLFAENPANFAVAEEILPPPGVDAAITWIYHYLMDNDEAYTSDLSTKRTLLLDAADHTGYQTGWKDDTRVNKLINVGNEYFAFLVRSEGKIILTNQEHDQIEGMTASLMTSEIASILEDQSIESEKAILFEVEGIKCKALLDKFKLRERSWTEWDLKTTAFPVSTFMGYSRFNPGIRNSPVLGYVIGAFQSFGYYRQRAFYKLAIDTMLGEELPYSSNIIAIESRPPFETRVFPVTQEWMDAGKLEVTHALSLVKDYLTRHEYFQF